MCGISGWFDIDGTSPPDKALARAMNDAIRHRGPDGEGFHFEPGLALGHRRLAIIDLDTGDQPMFTEGGRVAIVFNGEIYNYRELRGNAGSSAAMSFDTRSDTEVILRAWIEWGEACVEHLHGHVRLRAVGPAGRRRCFLARDRLGEKPLYYALLPDGSLIFGSELKALMVHPDLPRRSTLARSRISSRSATSPIPSTIYATRRKLAAGLHIDSSAAAKRRA